MNACTFSPPAAAPAKTARPLSRGSFADGLLRLIHHRLATLAVFLLAGLAVYAPALNGEPIWDDEYLVGQNPFFRSPVFALEVFRHYLFFDSFSIYYRPVQNLSYMLDYWLWAGNPFGYHLTNVLLHALSGFLLFRLLRRLLPGLLGSNERSHSRVADVTAFLVALVWTVHPMHNAAVAYIAGRADSLASLFALTAWLLVRRAPEVPRRWQKVAVWSVAAFSMLVALCSKEIALMWLVLFLLHLFFFEKAQSRRAKLALFGGVAGVFAIYFFLHSLPVPRAPMDAGPSEPLAARVLLMLRAVGDYTGLIFCPVTLMMDRTLSSAMTYRSVASWHALLRFEYLSVLGSAALVFGAMLCGKAAPGRRLRVFGGLWFVIAFLPISNLFPLNAQVAEHWIYLASIGYLALVAGGVLMLSPKWRTCAVGLAAAAIVALGVRTALRAAEWSGPEAFYTATIAAGGGTPRIAGNLAAVYAKRGEFTRQEEILRRMLQLFPEYSPARISLGVCLVKQGRAQEAEEFLQMAAPVADEVSKRFPRTWSAALNLAGVRASAGQTEEALAILAEALGRFPGTWELVKYQADLRQEQSGPAAAIPAVAAYARAHWWHQDSWLTLGRFYAEAGQAEPALSAMRHAARLDIYDPRPFANIARIEMNRNRPEAACAAQQIAIRRDPHQPSRYLMLADLLEKLGRKEEAATALRQADELRQTAQPKAS